MMHAVLLQICADLAITASQLSEGGGVDVLFVEFPAAAAAATSAVAASSTAGRPSVLIIGVVAGGDGAAAATAAGVVATVAKPLDLGQVGDVGCH